MSAIVDTFRWLGSDRLLPLTLGNKTVTQEQLTKKDMKTFSDCVIMVFAATKLTSKESGKMIQAFYSALTNESSSSSPDIVYPIQHAAVEEETLLDKIESRLEELFNDQQKKQPVRLKKMKKRIQKKL